MKIINAQTQKNKSLSLSLSLCLSLSSIVYIIIMRVSICGVMQYLWSYAVSMWLCSICGDMQYLWSYAVSVELCSICGIMQYLCVVLFPANEHDLLWIPRELPTGVNMLISTLPGRVSTISTLISTQLILSYGTDWTSTV